MINKYLDTFGSKHKGNFYEEILNNLPNIWNVQQLLNTIALIIYKEMINRPYRQIESAHWTTFESKVAYDQEGNKLSDHF